MVASVRLKTMSQKWPQWSICVYILGVLNLLFSFSATNLCTACQCVGLFVDLQLTLLSFKRQRVSDIKQNYKSINRWRSDKWTVTRRWTLNLIDWIVPTYFCSGSVQPITTVRRIWWVNAFGAFTWLLASINYSVLQFTILFIIFYALFA